MRGLVRLEEQAFRQLVNRPGEIIVNRTQRLQVLVLEKEEKF